MPLDLTRLSRTMAMGLQISSRKPLPIPLETIPDEILEYVLSFCAQREVLAVSLTCWRFSSVASASLYRNVKSINPRKSICFFRSICLRESLGAFVRKCEVELSFSQSRPPIASKDRNPLQEIEIEFSRRVQKPHKPKTTCFHRDIGVRDSLSMAAAALKKMPNLSHLELFFPEKEIQTDYSAQLLGGCPFRLRHFHTNLRFDVAMARFLRSQPNLQDLRFHSSAPFSSLDMTTLTEDALPRLHSLGWSHRVSIELVRHLVKGRPIHTINVHLPAGLYDISDLLAIGPEASLMVRTANLIFGDNRYPIYSQLEVLTIQFPNLTGLGIAMVALTHQVVNDLYKVVKDFKQLERLFIYDDLHDPALTRAVIIQYAKSFWNRCGTLRRIGFYVCNPFLMVEKATTATGKVKTVLWVVQS